MWCRLVDLCCLRCLLVDLCFRAVRERVRLCFALLCGGVGTLVGGYCCEAGVVGNGCAGVVLVGCDVGWYVKDEPHSGGDA